MGKKFVKEYGTTKENESEKKCFDEGRNAGYLGICSSSQSLKSTFNKQHSIPYPSMITMVVDVHVPVFFFFFLF